MGEQVPTCPSPIIHNVLFQPKSYLLFLIPTPHILASIHLLIFIPAIVRYYHFCQNPRFKHIFKNFQKPPYSYIALITMAINSRQITKLSKNYSIEFIFFQSFKTDDSLRHLPMDHDQLPLLFIEQTGLAELYPTQPFTQCLLHQGHCFTE